MVGIDAESVGGATAAFTVGLMVIEFRETLALIPLLGAVVAVVTGLTAGYFAYRTYAEIAEWRGWEGDNR